MTTPDAPAAPLGVRGLLRGRLFRRFWSMLGVASLGDWMGLLALTAFANAVAGADYADRNFAIAGVLFLRVVPALLIGPFGGYVADRLDRRATLFTGLALRAVLFASIPLVGTLWWLFVVTVLVEAVNAVWLPTKDAAVPTLVHRRDLEDANRVNLATTYGFALPAAALFIAITALAEALSSVLGLLGDPRDPAALVLFVVAGLFAVGALFAAGLHGLPRAPVADAGVGILRSIADGWGYAGRTQVVRGLVVGVVGAFAAGGVVIGLGRVYVTDLGAGDPGYGVLFGAVFAGLGLGMWRGPTVLRQVTRRRLFGVALVTAGVFLLLLAAVGNMVLAAVFVLGLGFASGVAWITGYTLLGHEVDEDVRGRTFALVQSLVRLALALVLAVAPLVAGVIGTHRFRLNDDAALTYSGAQLTFAVAALAAVVFGVVSFRQMNDRPGVSLLAEIRSGDGAAVYAPHGVFVALEGGEGAGKSTQSRLLEAWLREDGYQVVLTREPGDTAVGATVRGILLDPATGDIAPRTEALLYAADKAEHVATVVRPALDRGAVVVTDRYVDSTLAYQGAGRVLDRDEVERVARWATGSLRPHLTVLLDVDPTVGLGRFDDHDRLESEPLEFHGRVRASFLELAAADPEHYLVLDASDAPETIAAAVAERLRPLLATATRAAEADA
ncbi:dTMP kinase [Solicola sp. PLA-1-18]|uniref:dTMP kinase n=1 Tax=Solicola sp. PLA-1-18 TaxID=3380532 RepID=UPI003B7602A7